MSKKLNGLLIVFLLLGLIASITVAVNRIRIEGQNRTVDLVMDYEAIKSYCGLTNYPIDEFLLKLKKAGLISVAVSESRLSDHVENGRAIVLPISTASLELIDKTVSEYLSESIKSYVKENPEYTSLAILPKDDSSLALIHDLKARLINESVRFYTFSSKNNQISAMSAKDYRSDDARYIVFTTASSRKLSRQRIGVDRHTLALIEDIGLNIVVRFKNFSHNTPYRINAMFSQLDWVDKPSTVVFEGRDFLGYNKNLSATAAEMEKRGLKLGLIELSRQRGEETLSAALDYNVLRVHGVSEREMKVLKQSVVIDRYIRAVKEREARILYLRPFPERKDSVAFVSKNISFISQLSLSLRNNGFYTGEAKAFSTLSTNSPTLYLAALGTASAAALLSWYVFGFSIGLRLITLALSFMCFVVMMVSGKGILARQFMALAAAIVMPSLSVISQYHAARHYIKELEGKKRSILAAFWFLLRMSVISAIGGLLVVGLLGDIRFMTKLSQFIGVKLMHIMPLFIIAFVLWGLKETIIESNGLRSYVKRLLAYELSVKTLIAIGLVGFIGLVYISRTGNESAIPVLGIEQYFRNALEKLLVVRPRTKEFLFGHPLLILGFAFYFSGLKKWAVPAVILGSIGQASLVNTFTHIHTPLLVTCQRWAYGVILGGIIGIALIWFVDAVLRLATQGNVRLFFRKIRGEADR